MAQSCGGLKMSLNIIAYDPKKLKERKDKFKEKYGVSYEKFEYWMLVPTKNDFFYFLHPEFLESDTKKYIEMAKEDEMIQNFDEIYSFHISYGDFYFLRKELGEMVGVRFDDKDLLDARIYYGDELKDSALLRFLLHSDCDGMFSTYDVQKSYEQFLKFCDGKKLQEKKTGKWRKEIGEFLNFWQKSAERKLQWKSY